MRYKTMHGNLDDDLDPVAWFSISKDRHEVVRLNDRQVVLCRSFLVMKDTHGAYHSFATDQHGSFSLNCFDLSMKQITSICSTLDLSDTLDRVHSRVANYVRQGRKDCIHHFNILYIQIGLWK